ncbi:MAG TPA: asparagine synthase (glutamine-hydrolyzing) [Candidatus Eisenbacteria bacterium]|nr:asparagine synthase (glutamine-hydrolyzing) [Candidatus Eisenbacteria bacterium]
MCGIAGVMNCGDREVLLRMTMIQSHRGPDDSGIWDRRSPDGCFVGLGSRRLAILDLSPLGRMPMCNHDHSIWITYNGEIYNFADLRQELESTGCSFKSHTDTEVLLHLYEKYGTDCVKRLNGMFSFAICDLRSGSPILFVARDHFGVKPFYYFHSGERFAFASEVKALLQVPGIEAELDPESLHQYLTFLWVPGPKTMFQGIFKLPAGHFAIFRDGELKITQYWDLTFPQAGHKFPRSEADLSEEIRERFRKSVRTQMVSDVPIGAFLSAGLDSSSIVAMMRRATNRPVRTYTITFPKKYRVGETTLDDPDVATRLAHHLGCENQRIVVEPDVTELLPKLVWHMDEPTADPAMIAAYLVCREARKQATVLLSGVGGDELFAGYRKHIAQRWAQTYRRIPGSSRHLFEAMISALPGLRGTALKGGVRLAKKMARSASLDPVRQFIANCTYLDENHKNDLYNEQFSLNINGAHSDTTHRAAFNRVADADFLNQMLYVDTKIFMTSLNLTYNDKMSMASSVEVRVPFLDRELAEFVAWNVPPELKLKGFLNPTTKYIFRKAMHDLPEEVLQQPKAGFAAPVDYWLAHDLKGMVEDLLSPARIKQRGLFKVDSVRRLVEEQRTGRKDWSLQIWQFLTLELWIQTFLEGGARRFETDAFHIPQVATA